VQRTIKFAQWVFALALLPDAGTVAMPTRRWHTWRAAGLLRAPEPDRRRRPFLGYFYGFGVAVGLVGGMVFRAATLSLLAKGWSGLRLFALHVAGLPLTVGIGVVIALVARWRAAAR
jgi:hypothetical protein